MSGIAFTEVIFTTAYKEGQPLLIHEVVGGVKVVVTKSGELVSIEYPGEEMDIRRYAEGTKVKHG